MFLLIFFNSQCYERYNSLTRHARHARTCINNVDLLLMGVCNGDDRAREMCGQVNRYMLASHYLAYMHVSEAYRDGRAYNMTSAHLLRTNLLTLKELEFIEGSQENDVDTCRIALTPTFWALKVVDKMEREDKIPKGPFSVVVRSKVLEYFEDVQQIFDRRDLYIPFPYFHLQNLIASVFLSMRAYSDAAGPEQSIFSGDDALHFVIFVTITLCICALRCISQALIYPFGDDPEDLPGARFWTDAAFTTKTLINADQFDPVSQPACPDEDPELIEKYASVEQSKAKYRGHFSYDVGRTRSMPTNVVVPMDGNCGEALADESEGAGAPEILVLKKNRNAGPVAGSE